MRQVKLPLVVGTLKKIDFRKNEWRKRYVNKNLEWKNLAEARKLHENKQAYLIEACNGCDHIRGMIKPENKLFHYFFANFKSSI